MGRRQALIAAATLALATPATADDLKVSVPDEVTGDGRTVVPVNVTALLAGGAKPLPVAEVAVVTCNDAPGLAAINSLPAVLVPAVTTKQTYACTARLRDSTTKFQVKVRPPAAGLYASTYQVARATEKEAALKAFVFDGKRAAVPSWLKASASDGTITLKQGGILSLGLSGKAPRTIAIALIDGKRVGAAFVPVTGSTVLPVESEPGSSVQVWVAGTWFGPVPTKGKIAEVPIDVPAGVTHGVARSTDKKGYVSDVVIDLKIPARPRIAVAAAAPSIGATESTTLAVAIAGPDARPLGAKAKLVATAERGKVEAPQSLGGGLWTVRYTAPDSQGADRITVQVDGDPNAGSGDVELNVRGLAAKIELAIPPAFEPGSALSGTIRVLDAGGIVLREPDISVTLGGEPVEVTGGDTLTLVGKAPEKAPASGVLPLEIVSGPVTIKANVFFGGWPETASIHATARERDVTAELRVVDRFGNLVPQETFEVSAAGGTLGRVERKGNVYVASLTAFDESTSATLVVKSKGKTLAEDSVVIDAPGMMGIGLYATGGWLDNLGAFSSPRAALGGAFKKRFETFEAGALLGIEAMSASDSLMVDTGAGMQMATRSISGIAVPLALRARVRLGEKFGLAAGAAFVPWFMRVQFGPDGQDIDAYGERVFGVRGQLTGDMILGPGRVVVGLSYGRAALSDGPVTGQIDGLAFNVGYEWWFRAIAP